MTDFFLPLPETGDPVQFVLLIFQGTTPLPSDPDAWNTLSPQEQKQIYQDYGALNAIPGVSPGVALGLPKDAVTVQVKDGATVRRDGTYLPEGAGGYLVYEAEDLESAIEVAAKIPAARLGGAIEVRPVGTYW
jgi:hypothetical protein